MSSENVTRCGFCDRKFLVKESLWMEHLGTGHHRARARWPLMPWSMSEHGGIRADSADPHERFALRTFTAETPLFAQAIREHNSRVYARQEESRLFISEKFLEQFDVIRLHGTDL